MIVQVRFTATRVWSIAFAGMLTISVTAPASAQDYQVRASAQTSAGFTYAQNATYGPQNPGGIFVATNAQIAPPTFISGNIATLDASFQGATWQDKVTIDPAGKPLGSATSAYASSTIGAGNVSGSAWAAADLSTGSLQAFATGSDGDCYSGGCGSGVASALLTDQLKFSVAGANSATITPIAVTFSLDGKFGVTRPRSIGDWQSYIYGAYFGNASVAPFGSDYGLSAGGFPAHFLSADFNPTGWRSFTINSFTPTDFSFTGIYDLVGPDSVVGLGQSLRVNGAQNVSVA